MLKSFQIENFNSIKDPIIFSMEAETDLSEKKNYINQLDSESQLLKVASIYGPNASGKSTLLLAMNFVKDLVSGRLSKEYPHKRSRSLDYAPFEFTNNRENKTTISLLFARSGIEYWYKITANYIYDNDLIMTIQEEFFGVKKENRNAYDVVFSREGNLITANNILKIIGASKLPVSNNMTLLRHLNMNYIDTGEDYDFSQKENSHLQYVAELYQEIQSFRLITNLSSSPARAFRFSGEKLEKNKHFIIKSLQRLDINISDIEIEKLTDHNYHVYCIHKINGIKYKLRLEQESQGTALLIYLLTIIVIKKNSPTIFLIDELDSHLHPKLVREIIRLFNSDFNHCNQLIFNSHDMWNMTHEHFRRDQIWFTYRNDYLSTKLLCLSDVINYKGERVRKDAKYSKQYMEGKYGADPFIRKGLEWYGK